MNQRSKKLWSLLLSLVMVVGLFAAVPIAASAAQVKDSDGYILLPTSAEGLEVGDYYFDVDAFMRYMLGDSYESIAANSADYNDYFNYFSNNAQSNGLAYNPETETFRTIYDENTYYYSLKGEDDWEAYSSGVKKIEPAPATTYDVTITAGSNMTTTGDASQTGLTGAMTDVVYTAADGYYFPTSYSVDAVNGIEVTRIDYTHIKVHGTPTANAEITLPAPTAKTTPDAPTAAAAEGCTTADNNDGKLTGVTTDMEYKSPTPGAGRMAPAATSPALSPGPTMCA